MLTLPSYLFALVPASQGAFCSTLQGDGQRRGTGLGDS